MSLDEFKWVWKDSTKDEILKQYYFDYINWKSVIKEWQDLRDKAIEYIEWHYKDNQEFYKNKGIGLNYLECDYLLNILQGSDEE